MVGRVFGEFLPAAALVGAGLIVAGVAVSELKPPRWLRLRRSASA
jgi:drug/metabolite transporter (DMT)-like permease